MRTEREDNYGEGDALPRSGLLEPDIPADAWRRGWIRSLCLMKRPNGQPYAYGV